MRAIRVLLALTASIVGILHPGPARAVDGIEATVQAWEAQDRWNPPPTGAVVVTGSSTIQSWSTIASDLAPLTVIPRGLGGSTAADIDTYLERIVLVYRPRAVVLYEGDNDIGGGWSPQYFADRMAGIMARISARLPGARIFVISIKPSVARWSLWWQMTQANQLMAALCSRDARYTFIDIGPALLGSNGQPRPNYYAADGLHLNAAGYAAWTGVIRPVLLSQLTNPAPTVSLTAAPSTVVKGNTTQLTWTSSNATSCTAWGGWSGNKTGSGTSISPVLYADSTFGLTCSGPGGSTSTTAYVVVTAPTPAPTVSLSASPSTVTLGNATRLSWTTSNASSCMASGGWSGSRAGTGAENSASLPATTTFLLTCTGPGGSASASSSVVVTIPTPAPMVTLAASPASLVRGNLSQLSWSSTNASDCTASGGWNGSRDPSGVQDASPPASTTFVLTCTGPGGTGTASAPVEVTEPMPPPTVSLFAMPSSVTSGETSQLSWISTNASTCSASDGWSGNRAVAGTENTAALLAATSFVLTCNGAGGTASSSLEVSITAPPPAPVPEPVSEPVPEPVPAPVAEPIPAAAPPPAAPPTVSLTSASTLVAAGESVQLSWTSSNGTSCAASGGWSGDKSASGSESSPTLQGATSFTMTCTGPGGSAMSTLEVSIRPPLPSVTITATPASVTPGGKTQLSWTSSNADSCEANGGWNGIRPAIGGEQTMALAGVSTFGLQCTGAGGTANASVTIEIAGSVPTQVETVTATSSKSSGGGGGGVIGAVDLLGLLVASACRRKQASTSRPG